MIRTLVLLSQLTMILSYHDQSIYKSIEDMPMKYCGEELNKKLTEVCKGSFYSPPMKKSYKYESGLEKAYTWLIFPSLQEDTKKSVLEHTRLKRQVSRDCCYSALGCTVRYMTIYCSDR